MKRALGLLVMAALVLLVAGCAVEKTYYYTMGGTVNGFCEEVITNNADIQNALSASLFVEGTCAAQGFSTSGNTCTFSAGTGSTTYDIVEYWGSAVVPTYIQSACTMVGGTYH
jgi:hypothetical protein